MHPRRLRCFFLTSCPVFSVVAPCRRDAFAASVRRMNRNLDTAAAKMDIAP
jgi:hypothetical protein